MGLFLVATAVKWGAVVVIFPSCGESLQQGRESETRDGEIPTTVQSPGARCPAAFLPSLWLDDFVRTPPPPLFQ